MTKKTDDLLRYLQATAESDDRLLAESKKSFSQNLFFCFAGFFISIAVILWFDLSIASKWGFVILLLPIYFLMLNISELCQNMSITTVKLQALIRLNASQLDLEFEIESQKGQKYE